MSKENKSFNWLFILAAILFIFQQDVSLVLAQCANYPSDDWSYGCPGQVPTQKSIACVNIFGSVSKVWWFEGDQYGTVSEPGSHSTGECSENEGCLTDCQDGIVRCAKIITKVVNVSSIPNNSPFKAWRGNDCVCYWGGEGSCSGGVGGDKDCSVTNCDPGAEAATCNSSCGFGWEELGNFATNKCAGGTCRCCKSTAPSKQCDLTQCVAEGYGGADNAYCAGAGSCSGMTNTFAVDNNVCGSGTCVCCDNNINPVACDVSNCQSNGFFDAYKAFCLGSSETCKNNDTVNSFPVPGNVCASNSCQCCGKKTINYTTCTVDTLSIKNKGIDYQCKSFSMEDITATIGDSFDLSYRFMGTGPTYPWEVREIARGIPGDPPEQTTRLTCIYNENWPAGEWQTTTQANLSCPATPGTYDYTVTCRPSQISDPSACDVAQDAPRCRVKCIAPLPIAVGFIRMKGPGAFGIMELRIISVADALSASNGMVKIKMANGIIGAADLMPPTSFGSANYSPVRVKAMKPGVGSVTMMWRKR